MALTQYVEFRIDELIDTHQVLGTTIEPAGILYPR
jgi:hypothetical protein